MKAMCPGGTCYYCLIIQSCVFYENANGNPLERNRNRGSVFTGVTVLKYFL